MIVDAHLHVDDIPSLGWKLQAAECVRRMDEAGIERGWSGRSTSSGCAASSCDFTEAEAAALLGGNAGAVFGLALEPDEPAVDEQ